MIFTPQAPSPTAGSSQAIAHDGLLYVSGQLPIDPDTGQMLPRPLNPLFGGGDQAVSAQTRQCLQNLDAICRAAGADLAQAIRLTIHTPLLIEFGAVIDHTLREFLTTAPPARSMISVNVLESNSLVLVDAIVPLP